MFEAVRRNDLQPGQTVSNGTSFPDSLRLPEIPEELRIKMQENPLIAPGARWTEGYRGPFFIQDRIGIRGEPFRIVKFKTMDPEVSLPEAHENTPSQDIPKDPRITRFGRFLRRFYVDELPNVLAVLQGHMKLVGLRPVMPSEFVLMPDDLQRARVEQRPGLLCVGILKDNVNEADREYLRVKEKQPGSADMYFAFRVLGRLLCGRLGK